LHIKFFKADPSPFGRYGLISIYLQCYISGNENIVFFCDKNLQDFCNAESLTPEE